MVVQVSGYFGPCWSASHRPVTCNLNSTFLLPPFVLSRLQVLHEITHFGMGVEQIISGKEVAKHNTRQSCWIIVHGEATTDCLQISGLTSCAILRECLRCNRVSWRYYIYFFLVMLASHQVFQFGLDHPGTGTFIHSKLYNWQYAAGGSKIILKYAGKDAT